MVDERMPHRGFRQAVSELYESRDILRNMIRRDYTTKHKNNVLGVAWSILNPLLLVAIFSVVFKYFLGVKPAPSSEAPFAVWFFAGLTFWNLFAVSVTTSVSSIIGGAYLIHKVYFPREILPISMDFSAAIQFVFEFVVLVGMIVVVSVWGVTHDGVTLWPTWSALLAPLYVIGVIMLAIGFSLLLSALTVRFRDMEHFTAVLIQAWFWMTPVIYSMDLIDSKGMTWLSVLWRLNPVTPLVIGFRDTVVDGIWPSFGWTMYSLTFAVAMMFGAYTYFRRQEPLFAELI